MRRIAIAAAKGGTGKTTTAVALAHGLALAGERVLLVDCDPRRDAGLHFGLRPEPGLAAWLCGRPARVTEVRAGLRVLDSGGEALADLELTLGTDPNEELRLGRALDAIRDVDYVVLDCPAGVGPIARAALRASHEVLVPLCADYLSLASAGLLLERIVHLRGTNGAAPRLLGLLPTFYDADAPSAADVDSVLAELHAGRVLQTRIALCDGLRAAPARRGTIFDCEPLSRAALDYVSLIEEVRAAAA